LNGVFTREGPKDHAPLRLAIEEKVRLALAHFARAGD
jgi:hypothetical protein